MAEEEITLQGLSKRFDELMVFLVDNVAMKADLRAMEERMEKRFDGKLDLLKNDLMSEIRSVRYEVELLRRDVESLEKRITEDSDVFAADIVELKQRVEWLEKKVKQFSPV
ncbi:MAG: hypothetical protein AAB390_04340 [Patescibacteria group bacterium]